MISKLKQFLILPYSKKVWMIRNLYYRAKTQTYYKLLCKTVGQKSAIRNPLFLSAECISLGNNVIVWDGGRIEGIHKYANQSFNPHIIFEDGVSIQQRCHITAAGTLVIGKDSMISFDVSIQDTDHEYKAIGIPISRQNLIYKETRIGENCFIGSGVKILAGTILGKHCVVGANSVLKGIYPEYSVIVGAPGRIVSSYNQNVSRWENKKGKKDEI